MFGGLKRLKQTSTHTHTETQTHTLAGKHGWYKIAEILENNEAYKYRVTIKNVI